MHIPVVGALTLTSVFALRGYLRCIVLQVVPGCLFKAVFGHGPVAGPFPKRKQKGVENHVCLQKRQTTYV